VLGIAVADNCFVALILFPSGIVANGLLGFPLIAHRLLRWLQLDQKRLFRAPFGTHGSNQMIGKWRK
jgi:hypothetical protein